MVDNEKKTSGKMYLNVGYRRGFFVGKTGRTNNRYPEELKMQSAKLVTDRNISYREVARKLGIQIKTQVHVWVKRYLDGKPFEQEAFRKGRPKTKFASVEKEMAYLKAEIEYLKKRYPNLHGE
ncbi:transposase [Paenibacillus favisporus]|uniref:transposase n=1 Tax=Paenibacillus favisporus TaxID=221028 RepID=UPI001F0DEAF6|nr:transposase [Paenibacillus favisporus]